MNKLKIGAVIAALAAPVALQAQALPQATVMVVDTDQIIRECTVCAAANTQLQQQLQQLQARAQQLSAPLRTEGQAIQTAVNALPAGQEPDAALQTRIRNYQTQEQTAQREIQQRQQTIERNRQFVLQQIGERVRPAIQSVMQQRGASVALDAGSVLNMSPALDVTAAVLAVVNQNTAPLNVTAPPPQQPTAAGQTPAATTQPAQPQRRPQGR
jgi:Skp family chaperone for outer membrane proteins